MQIFGFEIGRVGKKNQDTNQQDINQKTFSVPENTDGAVTIQTGS